MSISFLKKCLYVRPQSSMEKQSASLVCAWSRLLRGSCDFHVLDYADKSFPKSGSFSSEPVSPVRESYVEINGSGSATILEECVGSLSDAAFTHRIPSTGNIYDQIIRESGSYDLVMIPLNKSQSKDQSVHIKDLYRVLQKCKCPVLVIPIMPIGKQSPSDPPTPKVILFAVADHSARDACALHCATYAKQFGAKIIIANFLYIKPTVMDPDLRYEKQIEKAYALLETTKMEMIARGVSSDAIFLTLVRTNDTIVDALSETIADTSKLGVRMLGASVYRIDFVVIGSNGGGGISKVLGGESFGEKLFANSFVPMLICTAGTIPK